MDKEKIMEELEKRLGIAEEILADDEKTSEFADDVEDRFNSSIKDKNPIFFIRRIKELKTYIPLFISLVKSYTKKEYREIPLATVVAVAAALIYFLAPFDIIPDFIPGFGFVDDASIIAFCFLACKHDLDRYSKWRSLNKDIIDTQVKSSTVVE
ncbi:MAG: DUF1232 domain-containing protein [Erysipelotrichaceae bacterium]|nr:DUF1232 domain-containing protein [Erysipelotrichaceae bacterium]